MKVFENVRVYQCEFCKKKLFKKQAMELHEQFCTSNPANWVACAGCNNLKEEDVFYDIRTDEGFIPGKTKGFSCTKTGLKLYPPKVERKGLLKKYPETFKDKKPMPRECDLREVIW